MNFFKRIWFFALVGLIVFGLGTHVFLREKIPTDPIIIYKTVTPEPKPQLQQTDPAATQPSITHDRIHTPLQDHRFHGDTMEKTTRQHTYDWRDDSAFDSSEQQTDPWKNREAQGAEKFDSADNETYPPPNWYKTEDPVLRAEYYGAQMLKQFGDIPEVHTVSDWELKKAMGIIPTHEELISYLESLYHLFPREGTRRTLDYHRELRAKGVRVKMIPQGDPK